MSGWAESVVHLVVAVGLVVVLPLGLRLIAGGGAAARVWPLVGGAAAVSPWLPRGGLAVGLAALYAVATLGLAGAGGVRAVRWWTRAPARRTSAAVEVAVLTALVTPAVGASALLAERAGHELLGFDLTVLMLTVPHLHLAGFAAALVAGLVARQVTRPHGDHGEHPARRSARAASAAAVTVPVGTGTVLVGYFVGDWLELVGAAVLTAGLWTVGLLVWTQVRPAAAGRTTRTLLGTSAVVLAATMVLALWWAVGEATGVPHPTLDWMVATHGLGNALGFALCGVLAWTTMREDPL